ncbi:hypothetical protein K437DRAFT_161066 [Tilletiaria anomala UBC 951]|uniref:Uncharacterized protein n=1 Tax=Tilletiaria anomala (strain ATCC 24038 / CBS 436.72 / UBC 951) TaxID=1037660 RepID=A0A066VVE2_TILAU|nr:uncharacterized protein K437DRAFT_161066 [Tilletiaria anomala UBC 951]KDN42525.1 hypothetical protein K437DRAFT_161066 [Tilletiaria anomala UBC 951]
MNPRKTHVLLLDHLGLIQAVSIAECSLDFRTLFNQRWHTLGPGGIALSPPWETLSRENETSYTIWPEVSLQTILAAMQQAPVWEAMTAATAVHQPGGRMAKQDGPSSAVNGGVGSKSNEPKRRRSSATSGVSASDVYAQARLEWHVDSCKQAQRLLSNPAAAHLIEIEYCEKSQFAFFQGSIINTYLQDAVAGYQQQTIAEREMRDTPAENPVPRSGKRPTLSANSAGQLLARAETRHRLALLLSLLVACAQYIGPLELQVDSVCTSLSTWEFAFTAMKLAWRLLQPRSPDGIYRVEEVSLEVLVALTHLVDAIRTHPQHTDMSHVVKRLIAHPATYDKIMSDTEGHPQRRETWKRLLGFHLREVVAYRLWQRRQLGLRFGPMLRPLGNLVTLPGELVDENLGGGLFRQRARYEIAAIELDLLNEELLDSSLLEPLPGPEHVEARRRLAMRREHDGQMFYERLLLLQQQTLCVDADIPPMPPGGYSTAYLDPLFYQRHCSEKALSAFALTLDLIVAALKEIDAEGLSQTLEDHLCGMPPSIDLKISRTGEWLMTSATHVETNRYGANRRQNRRKAPSPAAMAMVTH